MPFSRTNDRTKSNLSIVPNWITTLIALFRG
jgi:hypothetical protein